MRLLAIGLLGVSISLGGCAASSSDDTEDDAPPSSSADALTRAFTSKGTGYYPANSRLEGGFVDRRGAKLYTLQQFLAGDAPYVAVAMDTNAFPYGTKLSIKELDEEHDAHIEFRVVDTGGAFRGKGRSRIDICTKNEAASLDPIINRMLHITVVADEN